MGFLLYNHSIKCSILDKHVSDLLLSLPTHQYEDIYIPYYISSWSGVYVTVSTPFVYQEWSLFSGPSLY